MLSHKSRWLMDAVMLFAGGVIALGIVLVIALGYLALDLEFLPTGASQNLDVFCWVGSMMKAA
jgi:hypothetical protein